MPLCDGEEHQRQLVLPSGCKGPTDELLLLRFTGEVFDNYEDYIKALNYYRQRIWSCKYTGEAGLTYEEAAASEHKIFQVISQFPAKAEKAAAKLVHHSLEPLDALKTSISQLNLKAAASITPDLAGQWISSVAMPHPVAGVPGVECIWKLYEHFRLKYKLPEHPPPELAERIRPVRQKNYQSTANAAAGTGGGGGTAVYVDANGFASGTLPDANGTSMHASADLMQQGAKQLNGDLGDGTGAAAITGDDDIEGGGGNGGESDIEDDDYKPSRYSVEDLPWRARGRGRGGAASRGAAAGGRAGRGKGRGTKGRWANKNRNGEEETAGIEENGALDGAAPALKSASLPATTAAALPTTVITTTAAAAATTAAVLPPTSGPSDEDLQMMIESLEDVERRMQPGSIKHGVLTLLKEVGEAGMSIIDLANLMMERGLKHWDEVRQARNSIASTCGHDPAFIRIAPGKFALRCLVPLHQLRSMAVVSVPSTQRDSLGETASRQLAAVEAAQAEAMKKLAEQKSKKGQAIKNNFKCPKCHRIAHAELSPLILCDTCPRSYHVACLGLAWNELPVGDWCCPKCVEATQTVLRRVMDLEAKKKEALERAATKDKAAEDKLLRRLLANKGKEGASGAGGGSTRQRGGGGGGNQSAAGNNAGAGGGRGNAGSAQGDGSAMKDGWLNRPTRRVLDDLEIVEEEKQHLARLQVRVKELQELAAAHGAADDSTADAQILKPSSLSLDRTGSLASQPSLPVSSFDGGDDTVVTRAKEAAEALEKLKLIIEGPPVDGYPPLLSDPKSTAALAEASTVAEFLALYGAVCEVDRDLTTTELVSAAAWPLDAASELSPLYRQLLLCCLLEQLNRDPPIRGRSRRWFAVLTDATWPEVLRRYLLATRVTDLVAAAAENGAGGGGAGGNGNGGEDEEADTGGMLSNDPGHQSFDFSMTSAASLLEPLDHIDILDMDDRQLAIHCAALLSRGGWWELPAVAHLRLLGMLCYDIAQGQNLREDINSRVADCTKLQTDWAKEVAAARRLQQKRALDGGGALDPSLMGGTKRRKSGNKKGRSAQLDIDATQDGDNDTGGEDGTQDGAPPAGDDNNNGGISTVREAEIEAELTLRAYRTDPLGLDRHFHRYWWLRGHPSHILVENSIDGSHAGVLTTVEQVDELLSKLNGRGPRENELSLNLRRKYDEIVAAFQEEGEGEGHEEQGNDIGENGASSSAVVFDVFNLPRPTPTDGRIKQKDLPSLIATATSAAVSDAKQQLDAFITETQEMGLVFAGDLKSFKRELKSCETPTALCDYLLHIERYYCTAAEGLPAGARNDELGVLLGEDEVALLPELISLTPPAGAEEEAEEAAAAEEVKKEEEEHGGEPMETDEPEAVDAGKVKTEDDDSDKEDDDEDEDDEDNQTKATGGGRSSRGGTALTAAAVIIRPVTLTDEFDDSDAEHAYLREKRMRRPARLWRSARERAVWLKLVLNAKKSAASNEGTNAGAQAAYCTHMLYDRGNKMLKIAAKLAEDTAKWQEAEAARAKAEAALNGVKGGSNGATSAEPAERPLMIRTGKFKSEEGMRIILKCIGKEPFPPGRQSTADAVMASEETISQCRWGYQCGVCMLAGDLLCCEHPDGCGVSVHPACTGLPFPQGQWICGNHDDGRVKGRARRQRASGGGVGQDFETGYEDSEMTESEEEVEKNSEEDSDDGDNDSSGGGGGRSGSRRKSRR